MRLYQLWLGFILLAPALTQAALPTNYSSLIELPGDYGPDNPATYSYFKYRGITSDRTSISRSSQGISLYDLTSGTSTPLALNSAILSFQGDKLLIVEKINGQDQFSLCDLSNSCTVLPGASMEGGQLLAALLGARSRLINAHGYSAFRATSSTHNIGKIFSPTGEQLYPSRTAPAPDKFHYFNDITPEANPYVTGFAAEVNNGRASLIEALIVKIENGIATQSRFPVPILDELEAEDELLLPFAMTRDKTLIFYNTAKETSGDVDTPKLFTCLYSEVLQNCTDTPTYAGPSGKGLIMTAYDSLLLTIAESEPLPPSNGMIYDFSHGAVDSTLDFSTSSLLQPGQTFIPMDMNSRGDIIGMLPSGEWVDGEWTTEEIKWAYLLNEDAPPLDNTLTVIPDDLDIGPEDSTVLNVDLNVNAVDLYGLEVECTADPAILKIESGVYRGLFDAAHRLDMPQQVDEDAGTWSGASSLRAPATAVTQRGDFASLNYTAQPTLGETDIRCTALGSDDQGNPIRIPVANATVKVDDGIHQPDGATVRGRLNLPYGTDRIQVALMLDGVRITTTTDENGNFSFDNIRDGDFTLSYHTPGHALACNNLEVSNGGAYILNDQTFIAGDINRNGTIDMGDVAYVSHHYGSEEGDDRYEEDGDINKDGKINIQDLALLGAAFGTDARDCTEADVLHTSPALEGTVDLNIFEDENKAFGQFTFSKGGCPLHVNDTPDSNGNYGAYFSCQGAGETVYFFNARLLGSDGSTDTAQVRLAMAIKRNDDYCPLSFPADIAGNNFSGQTGELKFICNDRDIGYRIEEYLRFESVIGRDSGLVISETGGGPGGDDNTCGLQTQDSSDTELVYVCREDSEIFGISDVLIY